MVKNVTLFYLDKTASAFDIRTITPLFAFYAP